MKKAIRTLTAAFLAAALAGCAGGSSASGTPAEDKTITVGATPVPHAEILNDILKDVLAKDGWTLEVTVFNDYVQPNTAVEEGELDANYFQTLGYMNGENQDRGLHLVAVAGVHIEPMGLYSEKITSLSDLADGAEIAVPNDKDNESRALSLLVAKGLLNDPGTEVLTETDFNGNADTNPHDYKITPIEAASLPRTLADVDGAVINGNYALEADLPATHPALFIEEFDADTTVRRTNWIVVKEGNENSEKIQALCKAIQSEKVQKFIDETYKGAVITSFLGADAAK
ncbi:MAG: MetQ/NlpA family ABC transporter substrate-binding protein [Solobacterium sp.]|nr:MetQ/NlpA family ABC transporter substrate-binding protein [Solobacterium sp.]